MVDSRFAGVLLDIDGVLVVSWEPIAGAVPAIDEIRAAGVPVAFVTNSTSKSRQEIADTLQSAGFSVGLDELVTAGAATASYLRANHDGARCLVLNDGSLDDLDGIDVGVPGDGGHYDVVVLGSGGPTFSWDALNEALRALADGAALVEMHGSPVWATSEGLCFDGPAFGVMFEQNTPAEATVIGKPAPAMFDAGLEALGVPAEGALMVGDDVRSDVLAAQRVGMTGALVRTGKFRPAVLEGLDDEPDHVVGSIADIPGLVL